MRTMKLSVGSSCILMTFHIYVSLLTNRDSFGIDSNYNTST